MLSVNPLEPGWLAPPSFIVDDYRYLVALFPDGTTFVLPPGAIAGIPSKRAKPGDTIIVYGIGFGPVTPTIPVGQTVGVWNDIASPIEVDFESTPATLSYYGLAPNLIGLYQFNIVVPDVPSNDLTPISFTLGGIAGAQTLYIAVENPND